MYLQIGSRAALYHGLPLPHPSGLPLTREPMDYDYICTLDEVEKFVRLIRPEKVQVLSEKKVVLFKQHEGREWPYELEIAYPGSTGHDLLDWYSKWNVVAPPVILLLLKESHKYLKNSPHFEKTRNDILTWRSLGLNPTPDMLDWLKRREAETYSYKHPNLNQGKMGFFSGDGVTYHYDHDWIHEIVAMICAGDCSGPAYLSYQKDGSEVLCDKKKWLALPEEMRLRGVTEEAMVLALERCLIPAEKKNVGQSSYLPYEDLKMAEWAFKFALQKVCTSITSGWFREYAWENYDAVLEKYPRDYAKQFSVYV